MDTWYTKARNTQRISRIDRSSIIPGILGLTTRQFISARELLTLLGLTSSCSAGDSRDKVFALFGIVVDADQHRLSADYTKTPEQVFFETAYFLIQQSHTLDILSFCTKRPIRSTSSDLPSWVPNWSRKCGRPLNDEIAEASIHLKTASYDWKQTQLMAIKGYQGPSQFVVNQRGGLTVMGRFVAEVTTTGRLSHSFANKCRGSFRMFQWAANTGKERFQTWHHNGFSKEKIQEKDQIWHLDGANVLFVLRKLSDGFVRMSECCLWGVSFTCGIEGCLDCSGHSCSAQQAYVEITIY